MADGTSVVHSAAGTRAYVRIGPVGVLPRYSTGSIALNSFSPTYHNEERTWWIVEDFDASSNPSDMYMLPCETANFQLGSELYKTADDAVPGTMRVRASRCGTYGYNVNFPIIITDSDEITSAYGVLSSLLHDANYMIALNTSLQNRTYSCILESFNISVDGYNGASPAKCQLSTKGLSIDSSMNSNQLRSMLTDETRRDKMTRTIGNFGGVPYTTPTVTGDADTYSGRFVNIKDCALSLNRVSYQQIISIKLEIQHEFQISSTARPETSKIPTIRSADRISILERTVKGSFQYLSSSSNDINLSYSGFPDAASFSLEANTQWASPLYIAFGPNMIFDMPAVYWQPRVEELSTGSPLVTINFIARSNIKGINEFVSGL